MARVLLLDIGNSNAKFAFAHEFPDGVGSIPTRLLVADPGVLPAAETALVSCVVPHALAALLAANRFPKVVVAGKDLPIPIKDLTSTPHSTGTDRLLCLLAASKKARGGTILSCGTALVFSGMRYRRFIGGYILPGPRLVWDALCSAIPTLPGPSEKLLLPPADPLGRSTSEAISTAVFFSTIAAIDDLTLKMMLATDEPHNFITGGYAHLVNPYLDHKYSHYENMVLAGLAILAESL